MDSRPILVPFNSARVCPKHLKRAMHRVDAKPSMDVQIEHAVALDDKSEFVRLIKCSGVPENTLTYIFQYDSVECAAAVLAGETDGIFNLKAAISAARSTPLHMAAQYAAYNLTSLFLEEEEEADMRIDFDMLDLKQALPLNVALSMLRSHPSLKDLADNSAFHLVLKLSSPIMRMFLETVRLLAHRTKDIDQEVTNYFKEGKMIEFGALLMVNCAPSSISLGKHEDDKSEKAGTLHLLQIFGKIGDKLRAYIRISRPKYDWGKRIIKDIATLFEDAGLQVNSKYTSLYVYSPPWTLKRDVYEKQMNKILLGSEVHKALCGFRYGLQGSVAGLHTQHNGLDSHQALCASRYNSQGSFDSVRAFHVSSSAALLKANPVQLQYLGNAGPKLCLLKGCRFFMTALRKGVRHL